jgi:hypothetical protein
MNLGRVSSTALMASGLAGVVMRGTYAALGGWALVSRDSTAQAAVGVT